MTSFFLYAFTFKFFIKSKKKKKKYYIRPATKDYFNS